MNSDPVILHITDVHFSKEAPLDGDPRTLALASLEATIAAQGADWQPSIICLTGDIGKRGKREDYELAGAWLTSLLGRFSLPKEALFICPGNHDVDREKASKLARPSFPTEADDVLAPPINSAYAESFGAYSDWAGQFGVSPYALGIEKSYLVGQRTYANMSFVALNTAWFCKDDSDKEKLWIGLPQLRRLDANGQFVYKDDRTELPITITLLHHPNNWLNPADTNASQSRPNSWDYLSLRSDVVLSGHAHGETRRSDTLAETALFFTGGATWEGKDYFNNFRLLRIEKGGIAYRSFEFDSRSPEQRWDGKIARGVAFPRRLSLVEKKEDNQGSITGSSLSALREKTQAHASRVLEIKSRAAKPIGELPVLTALQVAIAIPQEQYEPTIIPSSALQKGGLAGARRYLRLPFGEALGMSRRTLLLGELGTGKSTLVASAVGELQDGSNATLAFVVPAKQLALPNILTSTNLLSSFSAFLSGSIAPSLPAVQIRTLLSQSIEITIFLDGLDEIPNDRIIPLLQEFATLPEHWPTVRVVATGRPIELSGSLSAEWHVITATTLTPEEKLTIFTNEAQADCHDIKEAKELAKQLLSRLKDMPTLDQVVSTPLASRLFYSRIAKGAVSDTLTLGDLVYDATLERLGGWGQKDSKQKTTEFFEKYFPDAQTRSVLLGEVAIELSGNERWKSGEARRILASKLRELGASGEACAVEALEFFAKSGLVVVDEFFQFPIKVFFEMFRGIGIERSWNSGSPIRDISHGEWREVGFAATAARRKSTVTQLSPRLESYISSLSFQETFVPAAAHIVYESQSRKLGEHFIAEATKRKTIQIVFFEDAWKESARTIANALKIAGPTGFEWFYGKYLNPKYPLVWTGSALTGSIFREWVRLSIGNVADNEKQRIRELVVPLLQAETMHVYDIAGSAVFLVPEAFDQREKLTFLVNNLNLPEFSKTAQSYLREHLKGALKNDVDAALLSSASPLAAVMWLEQNPGLPPAALLNTSLRGLATFQDDDAKQLMELCKERLGIGKWTAFLRFELTSGDNRVSAGAAISLYDLGERSFVLLREPLAAALHDGAYVSRAEEILGDLLAHSGPNGARWLAKIIHDHSRDISGCHSGEVRLLLDYIDEVPDGPSLLAWAIIGLGEFVLPRYPEIRQRFRDLFSGPRGNDFRNALRQALLSKNSIERRAAAAVLVTCFPEEESLALQAIVKSTSGDLFLRWREWEEYLLSLNFGRGPLVALKSKLHEFPANAAQFGYRLLFNNKVELTPEQQKQVIDGILENFWYRVRETEFDLLRSPETASYLRSVLKSENESSHKAAELLLQLHKPSLTEDELVLCSSLTLMRDLWNRYALATQRERLKSDVSYSKAVADLGAKYLQAKLPRPLLEMLRISLTDSSIWEDIVWNLMCKDRTSLGSIEYPAFCLLELGWQDPGAGQAIGKAANKFLNERASHQNWSGDVYQWLALLTDEFVGLDSQQLEKIVLWPNAIHHEVTAALLFRLQKIPSQFNQHRRIRIEPVYLSEPYSEHALLEAARQSDNFPPGICEGIEATIPQRLATESEITRLRQAGSNGALIASVLAFCKGDSSDSVYIDSTMPIMAHARRPHNRGCVDRLLEICRTSHFESLKADHTTKLLLTNAVAKTFETRPEVAEAAALLLDLRGYLSGAESKRFFDFILQRPYATDEAILEATVRWLATIRSADASQIPATLQALKSCLATVNERKPEKSPVNFEEATIWVLLVLGFWLLSDEESEQATVVFWKGLKMLLRVNARESLAPIADAFEILEPLLMEVRPALLEGAVQSGQIDPDPFVRAAFAVFKAFAGGRSN